MKNILNFKTGYECKSSIHFWRCKLCVALTSYMSVVRKLWVATPFGVPEKCCGSINSTKFENKKYHNAFLKQTSNVNANNISQIVQIIIYKNR